MLDENELLFDELYEKTKDCGRTQFIKLLMSKEKEIKELKQKQKKIVLYLDSLICNELDLTTIHKHDSYLHEYQEIFSNCLEIIGGKNE